jgi:hypothetical protein
METDIQLIRNKSELEGTAYFEFLPGRYSGKHWNDTSVFLDEEVMCMIERPFMDTVPDYDHYSFFDVNRSCWQSILSGLSDLRTMLAAAYGMNDVEYQFCCIWPGTKKSFADDFDGNRQKLINLIDDFTGWVKERLHEHESIAVLGM